MCDKEEHENLTFVRLEKANSLPFYFKNENSFIVEIVAD